MVTDLVVAVVAVSAAGAILLLVLGLTSRAHRGDGSAPEPGAGQEPGTGAGPGTGFGLTMRLEPDLEPESGPALAEQARQLAAHADAAARRAEEAMAGVEAARLAYAEAETHRDEVGKRYDEAQLAYAEALRAVRDNQPAPPTEEQLRRRHEVDSAALAAYRRGELSVDELRTVFGHTGERSADQEAREQEAQRLAAREGELRRGYDIAVAAARVARERLHVAEVAAEACAQEAVDAAVEAQLVADRLERDGRRG